jgi:hypothetical protein
VLLVAGQSVARIDDWHADVLFVGLVAVRASTALGVDVAGLSVTYPVRFCAFLRETLAVRARVVARR